MKKIINICQNKYLQWVLITGLVVYQIVRLIAFANAYGGVEHDSGWFLGVSRSLAETGSYATMVSTIADPAPGGHLNIYNQYKVQDKAGKIYFFPESIGPSSIIPNALIIKLFGPGFWQYRAGPLLFFAISMLLASYLLYQIGGLLPIVISHLFLFFYPHLIIFLGYEAMGEIYSLAYILLAFVLLSAGIQAKKHRWLWFFACGLAAGLTVSNKLVGLLSLSGLVLVCGLTYWENRMSLKDGLVVMGGGALPLLIWELSQFMGLVFLFDLQTYQGYIGQRLDFFLNEGGSGVGTQGSGGLAFFWYKLLITKEISLYNDTVSFITFLIIFVSGPVLIWRFYKEATRRNIVIFLWAGWLVNSIWFIFLSKTGWVRHNWFALIFAVFLLSLLTAYFWQQVNKPPKWINRVATLFMTLLLLTGFIGQINSVDFFASDRLVERWYKQHLATNHTRIPWMIIPRSDQEVAVQVLRQLPPSARIFYPEGHKSAEIAVMSGRILYPIQRRAQMSPVDGDVILIGPSLISRWRKPTEAAITKTEQEAFIKGVMDQILRECPNIIFKNEFYLICEIPS